MAITVLIVDDEQTIADSLRQIIEGAGLAAVAAYSGQEAIRAAKELPPDILLSDILMPDLNGFEVGLQIKAIAPHCRLVFFSGQAATMQLAVDYSDTFVARHYHFALLPKPVHPDTLLKEILGTLTAA